MSLNQILAKIPAVFRRKVLLEAAILLAVCAVGFTMESLQAGQGYRKLTLLCALCLGCRLAYLIWIAAAKQYEMIAGEVIEIRIPKMGKRWREIRIKLPEEEQRELFLPDQYGIRKGSTYCFYFRGSSFLGAEEMKL